MEMERKNKNLGKDVNLFRKILVFSVLKKSKDINWKEINWKGTNLRGRCILLCKILVLKQEKNKKK